MSGPNVVARAFGQLPSSTDSTRSTTTEQSLPAASLAHNLETRLVRFGTTLLPLQNPWQQALTQVAACPYTSQG